MEQNITIQLTLKAARVNCGLTLIEAAKKFGIHRDTLWKYEQDSTRVPHTFVLQAEQVYGVPADKIFFGVKSEFFRMREKVSS